MLLSPSGFARIRDGMMMEEEGMLLCLLLLLPLLLLSTTWNFPATWFLCLLVLVGIGEFEEVFEEEEDFILFHAVERIYILINN